MSGGIAYVWDRDGDFNLRCNLELVELENVDDADDIAEVRELIEKHQQYTGSTVAESVLADWDNFLSQLVKVMPTDYKRVLQEQKAKQMAQAN